MKNTINLHNAAVLVTGVAGFIGSNPAEQPLDSIEGTHVIGLDNVNGYHDVRLKECRLNQLSRYGGFTFVKADLADKDTVNDVFGQYRPTVVVNLAAQAGVRYPITYPGAYIQSNLIGFYNVLEACRYHSVDHLVYASSSSVYGSSKKASCSTDNKVGNPVSSYAATKRFDGLLVHAYSKLYDILSTGPRFLTMYGSAERPDMAYFGFTNKLRAGEIIETFNYGNCRCGFTYANDIVEGILRAIQGVPPKQTGEDGSSVPPYTIYNIGNGYPENLLEFIIILQEELLRAKVLPADYDFESHRELVPVQSGGVPVMYMDIAALGRDLSYKPSTPLCEGLRRLAGWYKIFHLDGSGK